eukprot:TRINITY_DN22645_c0_g1_i2.p1 TRINITY_DN22645_c0_g1~~TRINITY_DN22645_c0_g1_i2.p1  ORF type:complete len:255 (-),score=70.22 TRINITY_DN22645_c0_g1_i2:226-990(-)
MILVGSVTLDALRYFFFFQAEDGIRDAQESRGLGDVYKRQDGYHLQLSPKVPSSRFGGMEEIAVRGVRLLIRSPEESLRFYQDLCGMKLFEVEHDLEAAATVYTLARPEPNLVIAPGTDQAKQWIRSCPGGILELKHWHGTEMREDRPYSTPQMSAEHRGYGHIGLLVEDVAKATAKMHAAGTQVQSWPGEGLPAKSAYVCDPDGYWVELMPRYKAPVYREMGKVVLDGEWTEAPPQKIRGLYTGLALRMSTMH